MGAKIEVAGNAVLVHGPTPLHGCEVIAHDLRSGVALILAGLAADSETVVAPGYLIDRGHASMAARLATLGADVTFEDAS
jgi:UDP-N-acetylglucosamine 1-carboxyvinyltransferase